MKPPRLFLSPPHLGGSEQEFIRQAVASNFIAPLGPMVDAFEKEFAALTGMPHCLALASGTAAMHLALCHLGVGPGDTVMAATLTFIGSVSPIVYAGARPIFIDCTAQDWNLDPDLLADALADAARRNQLPKAVIPTDLYGEPCALSQIQAICQPYQIPVICDSAEAVGARYQPTRSAPTESAPMLHAGREAWAAVFSFNGNKIMTTSGGGMLASADADLIAHARKLSQQARDDFPWYEHSEIGFNYRLSNILAAIGRGQLAVLEERVRQRQAIFQGYRERLAEVPGITFQPVNPTHCGNRWLTVILLDPSVFGADTHAVRQALEAENIEARPVWKPMHMQPVFAEQLIWKRAPRAVSELLFAQGLCLPSGTAMTAADLDRVTELIKRVRR